MIKYYYSVCLLLCLLMGAGLVSCKKDHSADGQAELSMLDSVNKLRSKGCKCGSDTMLPVKALIWNNYLLDAAKAHALDMYNNNYFDHISPSGTSPIQRALAAGYAGQYIGENIAREYDNITDVINAWKVSEDHCKAMMDPLYIEMGAYSYNGYWVQEFGY
jgi:uncharacterized protein YkwD